MSAVFVNAQQMHRENPDTFEVPDITDLADIKPGRDAVKVIAGSERFWILVTEVKGTQLKGTVNNDLINTHIHGLKLGDEVTVHIDNIIDFTTIE